MEYSIGDYPIPRSRSRGTPKQHYDSYLDLDDLSRGR